MLLKGNCLELLAEMPDNSVDSIVTDPPYELGFMGKSWDNSGIAYNVELWSQALRVLKPGGHLLAFGGSRTYHRLASAVEDAGFEIRDQIMWLYGSGFPKSHNVSKGIDKRGGNGATLASEIGKALQVARESRNISKSKADEMFCDGTTNWTWFEGRPAGQRPPTPETFARIVAEWSELASLAELVAEAEREVVGQNQWSNSAQHFVPGEDHTQRVNLDITAPATAAAKQWDGWGTALKPAHEPIVVARKILIGTVANNVLTYGTGALNIDGSRVGTTDNFDGLKGRPITKLATRREGETNEEYKDRVLESPGQQEALAKLKDLGRWPANVIHDGSEEVLEGFPNTKGVVRKPTGKGILNPETGWNANSMIDTTVRGFADSGSAARFFYCAKASKSERNAGLENQNFHPTVKPIALMRYLVKLVTPPNGTVLDPFLGSGTTAVAAILEGFNWMGCEMTEDYWPIIEARVAWAELQPKTLL